MNSISVNLYNYCDKFVNLRNNTQIDVRLFKEKLSKFYIFFYYT